MARIMARGREARGKKPGLESNRRGNDVNNIVARLSVIMRQNVKQSCAVWMLPPSTSTDTGSELGYAGSERVANSNVANSTSSETGWYRYKLSAPYLVMEDLVSVISSCSKKNRDAWSQVSSCSGYKFPKSTELRRSQDVKWKIVILHAIPAFRSEAFLNSHNSSPGDQ